MLVKGELSKWRLIASWPSSIFIKRFPWLDVPSCLMNDTQLYFKPKDEGEPFKILDNFCRFLFSFSSSSTVFSRPMNVFTWQSFAFWQTENFSLAQRRVRNPKAHDELFSYSPSRSLHPVFASNLLIYVDVQTRTNFEVVRPGTWHEIITDSLCSSPFFSLLPKPLRLAGYIMNYKTIFKALFVRPHDDVNFFFLARSFVYWRGKQESETYHLLLCFIVEMMKINE